jgi:DNA mismatch repair protein MSH5
VATHFYDVFDEEILDPESVPVSFYHMQVMLATKTGGIMDPNPTFDRFASASAASSSTTLAREERIIPSPQEKITYLYR